MRHIARRTSAAAVAIELLLIAVAPVQAQPSADNVRTSTITGIVTNSRGSAVVGAVIVARGSAAGWTATLANGTFVMTLPLGTYELTVRKGGYTTRAASVNVRAADSRIALTLSEANLNSVSVGRTEGGAGAPFNSGVAALATLPQDALAQRPELTLRNLATELSGVTLAHPLDTVPDTSFVVRGGTVETRVQIDGHAVSAGATGRWNSSFASLPLFDTIEVVKGAGLSGANAGESAFGTINLQTRGFSSARRSDVIFGFDEYSGSYMSLGLSGNAFANDRLSYVVEHNVYGYNGPSLGQTAYNFLTESNNTALILDRVPLNSPLRLGSDLAKARWRFSDSTSLTLGYLGIHGDYAETGGAYGAFFGNRMIIGSTVNPDGTQYNAPQYAGLAGQKQPGYSLSQNTYVQTNQPLFEAELRTAIHNDTVLVRPYVGTIFNLLDGSNRTAGPDPNGGDAWIAVTSGTGCNPAKPCFVPGSTVGHAALRTQEVDRLHGTTVTLIHPIGDATLNLSYDYRSDETTVLSGDPGQTFDGTLFTATAYLPRIPTTLARNFDWSATYAVPLTSRLRLFAGDYYTDWKLGYSIITEVPGFTDLSDVRTSTRADRTYRHDDPHAGLTYHLDRDTNFRVTGGSALTVPYANLVSGGNVATGLFTGAGVLARKNPGLEPESTIAYDLGVDHRFPNGAVFAADAFSNTVHNVFATQVVPFDPALFGLAPNSVAAHVFEITTTPINAPLERNFGLELSIVRAPVVGLGYRVSTTFQRAYLDRLSASFFSAASSLVNRKQLDGATSIPYTQAYAELNLHLRSGLGASLGANYTGTNNWTNGPAFAVFNSMLRFDLKRGYRAQLSVENLFDKNTGNEYSSGDALGGFASVNYGPRTVGGLPTYGATPTTRFAIAPRTLRLQIEAHVGP